jgi:hypothetical protein
VFADVSTWTELQSCEGAATMVKMTVGAVKAVGVEISVAIAPGLGHKSLESPRLHSLDMLQQNMLVLEQHETLVVIPYGDPFRKTGRIP